MNKQKIKQIIIGGLALTLTTTNTFTISSSSYEIDKPSAISLVKNTKGIIAEDIVIEKTDVKFRNFVRQTEEMIEQRKIEEERLRLEEEQRKIEEARLEEERRIAEINRRNSVTVEADNVLKVSNVSVDELIAVFDFYDYSKEMKELAPIIVEAEQTYGINLFVISAIASWESSYNTSYRAIYDNNVLGWGVYSASAEGINASSKYENIMNACKFLKEEYLTPGGLYYNGTTTWGISRNYCRDENGNPSESWREGVNSIAYEYLWVYKYLFTNN